MPGLRRPLSGMAGLMLLVLGDGVAYGLLLRYERDLYERGALLALVVLPLATLLILLAMGPGGDRSGRRGEARFRAGFVPTGAVALALFLAATLASGRALFAATLGAIAAAWRLPAGHWLVNPAWVLHNYVVGAAWLAILLGVAAAGGLVAARPRAGIGGDTGRGFG